MRGVRPPRLWLFRLATGAPAAMPTAWSSRPARTCTLRYGGVCAAAGCGVTARRAAGRDDALPLTRPAPRRLRPRQGRRHLVLLRPTPGPRPARHPGHRPQRTTRRPHPARRRRRPAHRRPRRGNGQGPHRPQRPRRHRLAPARRGEVQGPPRRPPAYPSAATAVRPCWQAHKDTVTELGLIWCEFTRIYTAPRPSLDEALVFHDRWLPGVLRRVQQITASCTAGCALDRPAWAAPPNGPHIDQRRTRQSPYESSSTPTPASSTASPPRCSRGSTRHRPRTSTNPPNPRQAHDRPRHTAPAPPLHRAAPPRCTPEPEGGR